MCSRARFLRRLVIALSTSVVLTLAQEPVKVPAPDPDLVAGPWESTNASGIHGVFFHIETGSSGPAGHQQTTWQTIDIRVYHREDGKETSGWFATSDQLTSRFDNITDGDSFPRLHDGHLRIRFTDFAELKPFDLDISFSPTDHVWTGTWTRAGQVQKVTLQRPKPSDGVTLSPFVGDWDRQPDPSSSVPSDTGGLHICQSNERLLSVWLNRSTSGVDPRTSSVQTDQRSGELLKVVDVTGDEIILETTFSMGPTNRYRGRLSEDNGVLAGVWEDTGGGRLNAPERFRRVP